MINKFKNYSKKSNNLQNLQDDITLFVKSDGDYIKTNEPLELVQITGLLTDKDEINKLEENMTIDKALNIGEVKRGETIWLTALLKKPGNSYSSQTLGVIKCRIIDYYYGLSKLNQITH